jgi:PEP-CTERM motif-containing protein
MITSLILILARHVLFIVAWDFALKSNLKGKIMKKNRLQPRESNRMALLRSAAAATILAAASFAAQAQPIDFTWDPSKAVAGADGPFTANNITVEDFAAVTLTNVVTGAFTENGLVNMSSFLHSGTPVALPGLDTGKEVLWVDFTATGTQTPGATFPPAVGSAILGKFTSLNYTFFAGTGVPTFKADASGGHLTGVSNIVALATGSLIAGTTVLVNSALFGLSAIANTVATFVPNPAEAGFFVSPPATLSLQLFSSFTNTGSVLSTPSPDTLVIDGGGGNATLQQAAVVPEPATLLLLGGGLVLLGLGGMRRYR